MKIKSKNSLLFALLGFIFYVPLLGGVHLFDWDEINFAEISREMIVLGDYLRVHINFEPFWEKPPLFMWMQAGAMNIFGINEFSARLPNAICGILTLIFLFETGNFLKGNRFGILWAGAYFGSILPFLYFKSGIIDPWFNLLIFMGLYFFILFYWKKEKALRGRLKRNRFFYLTIAGFCIGLAVLTKGPVAFLVIGLVLGVYWISKQFRFFISPAEFSFFTLVVMGVCGIWFGLEILKNGTGFVENFIFYQIELLTKPVAGHKGFFGYHFVVLLIGVFPASVFAVRAFFKMPDEDSPELTDFRRWLKYLFWVVLILFSLVQSKIVHYSSLCYFPLTYLAATTAEEIWKGRIDFSNKLKAGLLFVGGIYSLLLLALPFLGMNIDFLKPLFQKDPFALANLEAEVFWQWADVIPGVLMSIILFGSLNYFKKKNYKFGFSLLFGGTALFVFTTLIFIINKIEGYSQNAAIEFFKAKSKEDCYLSTKDYKSYAHLFYGNKQKPNNANHKNNDWLTDGEIDKTVYLAVKIHRAGQLIKHPEFREVSRKNGFVFFKRELRNNADKH